jgi:hypothetical protein
VALEEEEEGEPELPGMDPEGALEPGGDAARALHSPLAPGC